MGNILQSIPTPIFTWMVILAMVVYFIITALIAKNKPRNLWIPASILLAISTAFYANAYWLGGVRNVFSNLFISLSTALDLFLFKMNSTYGRFTDLFYLKESTVSSEDDVLIMNRLVFLSGLYLCSIWTTSLAIIHFFARRIISNFSLLLAWATKKWKGIYLFIGTSPEALAVAKSLGKDAPVVLVDMPAPGVIPDKFSIAQIFKGVKINLDASRSIREAIPWATVLKSKKPLNECTGEDFFKDLGLKLLKRWAQQPETVIFLFSGSERDNVTALQKIHGYPAQIYCHAKREGLALRMELVETGHLHIVDSSFLATKALKAREELYPIRYMNIAKDTEGQPLGYVEGAFNALVCGFGEAGQGMFSFLYEFGAFPDKKKQPNQFHCTVLDSKMDRLEGEFRLAVPGLDNSRVEFCQESIGSEAFWLRMGKMVKELNYVFVGAGPDEVNMKFALDILEYAFRNRPSMEQFIVVVKLDHPGNYQSLIGYFNQNYGGKNNLHSIGDIDRTWTWDNISGAGFRAQAQTFYAAYAAASHSPLTWEDREKQIMAKDGTDLAKKLELQRKTNQDFVNQFHIRVKRYLCPERIWKDPAYAADIPLEMQDGKHYVGNDPEAGEVLDYLAVGEHLRWLTSHQINGYRLGARKQEDLKTHTDIVPYDQLSEQVKHYDWIVVKTSLELLGKK